jgi:DNA gyrase subunit A
MRIVIELRRDTNAQVALNRLFASTQLQTTFAIVLLALVDNQSQPRILSLKQILEEYIAFQQEVIRRRTEYDLKKARERAHLLEGLRIACDNIDEVIRIIRTSYDEARERLMERFSLSEVQAQAILDMQLKRLQGLERDKIEAEYNELQERIAYFLRLLSDEELLKSVLIEELTEIRDKYGDDRRTEIAVVEDEIDIEDLIDEEECVYTLTHSGYIKRMPANTYRAQRRGGAGIMAMTTREEDYVETVFTASTHDYILFFTNFGRAYRKKGYLIPEAGRQAKGTNIINILPLQQGEKVSAMIRMRDFDEQVFIVFITKGGTVKRMEMAELKNIRNVGIRAITLDEDDELISVRRRTEIRRFSSPRTRVWPFASVRRMSARWAARRQVSAVYASERAITASAPREPARAVAPDRPPKMATARGHRLTNTCAAYHARAPKGRRRTAAALASRITI